MTYTHETDHTYVYDKFEYFAEDFDCVNCTDYQGIATLRRSDGHGCGRSVCRFSDLKEEAVRNNRIKRKRGWNKDVPCE